MYQQFKIININIIAGKWSSPIISGQCFPPCSGFAFIILSNNKALLHGGGCDGTWNNDIYAMEMGRNIAVSINYNCYLYRYNII